MDVTGQYHKAGCSTTHPAKASTYPDGSIELKHLKTGESLLQTTADKVSFGSMIPGLAVELQLDDGAYFVPDDTDFRWPQLKPSDTTVNWLETHWTGVLVAVVMTPLFIGWMLLYGIPTAAKASVAFIPDSVGQELGEQTRYILEKGFLEESEISVDDQESLRAQWEGTLAQLQLPLDRYQLLIRKSDQFGANAMALPDGTVVVTDDIINLLEDQPDALTAVLLHEIGHVEHKHSMKLLSQSVASSLLFAVLFNDIEGMGELVLGAGSGLLQSAFSRDMEREADQFAHKNLKEIGIPATAFADAMQSLMESHPDTDSESESLLKYFGTHPDTQERIKSARKADR